MRKTGDGIRNKTPMLKQCRYCKKEFKKISLNDVYCSIQCRLHHSCNPDLIGCWVWDKGKDLDGYGVISIKNKSDKAHRIAFKAFKGEIPEGMQVCHTCDNPSCINPDHLFLGTIKDNMDDMAKKGRDKRKGEESVVRTLNEKDVFSLIEDRKIGMSYAALGRKYAITDVQARNICTRKSWRHLDVSL